MQPIHFISKSCSIVPEAQGTALEKKRRPVAVTPWGYRGTKKWTSVGGKTGKPVSPGRQRFHFQS